ncbi:hypothetical protein CRG98_010835, partial [Punica granatum]
FTKPGQAFPVRGDTENVIIELLRINVIGKLQLSSDCGRFRVIQLPLNVSDPQSASRTSKNDNATNRKRIHCNVYQSPRKVPPPRHSPIAGKSKSKLEALKQDSKKGYRKYQSDQEQRHGPEIITGRSTPSPRMVRIRSEGAERGWTLGSEI